MVGFAYEDDRYIHDVIDSLQKGNPLRQQAKAILSDPHALIIDLQPILRAFLNRSPFRRSERVVATWLIMRANWSDDQREILSSALSASVGKAVRARKPGRVVFRWMSRSIFVSLLFVTAYMNILAASGGFIFMEPSIFGGAEELLNDCFTALTLSIVITIAGAVVSLPLSVWMDRRRLGASRRIVEALGHIGHLDSIPTIATTYLHAPLREASASALIRVTGRLQPEHYGALSAQTVPALCRALSKADTPTTLFILHGLATVGDGRAIGAVERIANGPHRAEVREAATKLLPILKQRAVDAQAASQLLRPSSATGEGEQVLLRAASGGTDTAAAELLVRASEGMDGVAEK